MRKLAVLTLAVAGIAAFAGFQTNAQADHHKKDKPVTITGKSGCAQCEGVSRGHDVFLETKSGIRIVLKKTDESASSYRKAHGVRKQGKKMMAVLEGPIKAMGEGDDAYLVAAVKKIKIKG